MHVVLHWIIYLDFLHENYLVDHVYKYNITNIYYWETQSDN